MEQLTLTEKSGANYILLELIGTVDSYTSAELQDKVYSYIKTTNVVLDMSQVDTIDSTGMGIIMAGFNDGLESGKKLYLLAPSPAVREAVDDTGFSDTFYIIHSVTEVA
ncbi:MAG: STAS domain-containing protein [Treponema sp.]|nr:STAS domain-containing protein [Treponema sp.]